MKPADIQSSIFMDFNTENNKKVLKYKNNVTKGHVSNWSEEVSVITKVKNTVLQTYVASDLNGEKIVDKFYKNELQKINKKEFRVEKVIKRKGIKLCVEQIGHGN